MIRHRGTRERRLWTLTALVVVTICLSLGLGSRLVGVINEKLLAAAFIVCLILVAVSVLTQGLRVRPRGREIGVVTGIVAVYVLLGVRLAIPERSHLMEYGVLAVFVYEALRERVANGRRVLLPAVSAFVATALVGVIDESLQGILPNRVFDWNDLLFNCLASGGAVAGLKILSRVRDQFDHKI